MRVRVQVYQRSIPLPIIKYKITLPEGNYNYYRYKDGVLQEIEIHHSFYSANILLVNN